MDDGTPIPLSPDERLKRRLSRAAYAILGVGGAIAVCGAVLGSIGENRSEGLLNVALGLRNVAAVVMLAGLTVLLVAQRWASLRMGWQRLARWQETVGEGPRDMEPAGEFEMREALRTAEGSQELLRAIRQRGVVRLGQLAVCLLLAWLATGSLPGPMRGALVTLFILLVPVVLTTAAVSLPGWPRAVCLGALPPAGALLVCFAFLMLVGELRFIWRRPERWFSELSEWYLGISLVWIGSFLSGVVAVIVLVWLRADLGRGSADRPPDRGASITDSAEPDRAEIP